MNAGRSREAAARAETLKTGSIHCTGPRGVRAGAGCGIAYTSRKARYTISNAGPRNSLMTNPPTKIMNR